LGQLFADSANRLTMTATSLRSSVVDSPWAGVDAESFRWSWHGGQERAIAGAADRLADAATTVLRNADEQEWASDAGTAAGSPGVTVPGSGVPGVTVGEGLGVLGLGIGAWAVTKTFLAAMRANAIGEDLAGFLAAGRTAGSAAASARILSIADMANVVGGRDGFLWNSLSKLGPLGTSVGKWLGPLGAVISIGTGIHDAIDPAHEGWRGVGDRIAGVASVGVGIGTLGIIAGAAAFSGPAAPVVVVAAGLGIAAWHAGNWVADNWDTVTAVADDVGEVVGDAWDGVTNAANAAGNALADAAGAAKNFIGGLFG
jgi:hypothetical protein